MMTNTEPLEEDTSACPYCLQRELVKSLEERAALQEKYITLLIEQNELRIQELRHAIAMESIGDEASNDEFHLGAISARQKILQKIKQEFP